LPFGSGRRVGIRGGRRHRASPDRVKTGLPMSRTLDPVLRFDHGRWPMEPLQFIFVACMSGAPAICEDVPGPLFAPEITWSECMLEGPAITEAWKARNPDRDVRSWTCRPMGETRA
jgi:hypothetical protein